MHCWYGQVRDKEIRLRISLFNTATGDVKVAWLDLNANERAAKLDTGNACSPSPHEGVKDSLAAIRKLLEKVDNQCKWFLRWMLNTRCILNLVIGPYCSLPAPLPAEGCRPVMKNANGFPALGWTITRKLWRISRFIPYPKSHKPYSRWRHLFKGNKVVIIHSGNKPAVRTTCRETET